MGRRRQEEDGGGQDEQQAGDDADASEATGEVAPKRLRRADRYALPPGMPLVLLLLVAAAVSALAYAVIVNVAHNAIARGALAETTPLRYLPAPVRRHAHLRLLPGVALPEAFQVQAPGPAGIAGDRLDSAPAEDSAAGEVAPGPATGVRLSKEEERAALKGLRRAARQDAPLPIRMFSAVRLVVLLFAITLAVAASIWLVAAFVVSLFSRAIRSG